MEIISDYSKYNLLVAENTFSELEIKEILDECEKIFNYIGLDSPENTGTGYYEDGTPKRKSSSIFIDYLFTPSGTNMSSILRIMNSKIKPLADHFVEINKANCVIQNTNSHRTLLNYYEENDHYDFHKDANAFTILHIFYQEPKAFSGGDLIFKVTDEEILVPIKNNLSIVFPAPYDHKVTEVKMNAVNDGRLMGRFSFAQFLGISI